MHFGACQVPALMKQMPFWPDSPVLVLLGLFCLVGGKVAVGQTNYALHLNGQDHYVDLNAVVNDLTGRPLSFTIEAWVYPLVPPDTARFAGVGGNGVVFAVNRPLSEGSENTLIIEYDYARERGQFIAGHQQAYIDHPLGQWYHLAVTQDSVGQAWFYINGHSTGAPFYVPWDEDTNVWLSLGQDWDAVPSEFFPGLLDDVRIWNRARSGQEIRDAMHETLTGQEAELVAYYSFDEGPSTVIRDASTYENDAVVRLVGSRSRAPEWVVSSVLVAEHSKEPVAFRASLWQAALPVHAEGLVLATDGLFANRPHVVWLTHDGLPLAPIQGPLFTETLERWRRTWTLENLKPEQRGRLDFRFAINLGEEQTFFASASRYRLLYQPSPTGSFHTVRDSAGDILHAEVEGQEVVFTAHLGEAQVSGQPIGSGRYTLALRRDWFLQWWAFALYVGIGGLVFYAGGRVRTYRLYKRNQELEHVVRQRTAEVTEQKEHIERQAEQLRELDRVKSEFFANISHEFRTPLTLIIGPLKQALADGILEPSSVERMLRNSQRLQRLINQILALAKLESGELRLQAAQHDLVAFARLQTEAFRSIADYRNIALYFQSSAAVVPLYFDAVLLEQALTNLLSNAVKFTSSGGRISVQITETNTHVNLTVADSGIGLAPDQQARVFERFYQVDATSTRAHEGTGIGLALTKELIELQGGSISVESQLGEGTAFCVQLPKGHSHLEANQIVSEAPKPPPAEVPTSWVEEPVTQTPAVLSDAVPEKLLFDDVTTLLVVEDNADMRAYIRSIFASTYRIREAEDGLEGLILARDLLPDLIISDVMMPHMDGLTMVQELAKETATASIPVVFLTARAAAEDELAGLTAGAVDYVRKPFDAPVLQARVRSLLHLRYRLREQYAQADESLVADPVSSASAPLSFTDQVKQLIVARLSDENLSVEQLAAEAGVSRTVLFQKLNDEGARPPSQMVRQMRLERAAQLLRKKAGSISEVAYGVGFSSLSYFSRCFKAEFGVSPSAYLEEPAALQKDDHLNI